MKAPLPLSLTSRLVLSHLIIGILSIGLISAIAAHFIIDRGRREVENFLEDTASLVSNNLEQSLIDNAGSGQPSAVMSGILGQFFYQRPEIKFSLYQADGKLLATNDKSGVGSTDSNTLPPEVNTALKGVDGEDRRLDANSQENYYVAIPISHEDKVYGALRLSAIYADQMSAYYRSLVLLVLIAVLLLSLI